MAILRYPAAVAVASIAAVGNIISLPSGTFPQFNPLLYSNWTLVIDTSLGAATGTPTVAAYIANPQTGAYVIPTKVNGATQAWGAIVTAASDVLIWTYNGPLAGVQLAVTTWATPGGTVYGYVFAN